MFTFKGILYCESIESKIDKINDELAAMCNRLLRNEITMKARVVSQDSSWLHEDNYQVKVLVEGKITRYNGSLDYYDTVYNYNSNIVNKRGYEIRNPHIYFDNDKNSMKEIIINLFRMFLSSNMIKNWRMEDMIIKNDCVSFKIDADFYDCSSDELQGIVNSFMSDKFKTFQDEMYVKDMNIWSNEINGFNSIGENIAHVKNRVNSSTERKVFIL